MHSYKPFSFRIKLDPELVKSIDSPWANLEIFLTLRSVETLQNNSYEEVKEDKRYDHHKTNEVDFGSGGLSTFHDSFVNLLLIGL